MKKIITCLSAYTKHGRACCVLLGCMFALTAGAQQIPVFSGYAFNRYLINPAFTGIDNEYRVFGYYRSQWGNMPGKPVTGGATAEGSFWKDQVGVGVNVMNDKAGVFNNTIACISYAQKIHFAKDHQLSVGIQGGAYINQVNFGMAHAVENNDPGLALMQPTRTVFDFSVGVGYKWKGLLTGFSVPNVIQPNAQYAASGGTANYQYIRHYTAFLQYRITTLHEKFNITPMLFMRKGPASAFQFDATVTLDYKNMVFIGGGYRNGFGAIGMAGVNVLNMFTVAYAYDYTTQPVLNGRVGSTHEVTFGFHIASTYRKKKDAAEMEKLKQRLVETQKANDSLQATTDSTRTQADSLGNQVTQLKHENKVLRVENDSLRSELTAKGETGAGDHTGNTPPADKNSGHGKDGKIAGSVKLEKPKENFDAQKISAEKVKKGGGFTLDKIYFEVMKYDLLPASKEQLDSLAALLIRMPHARIMIKGYTDNTGDDGMNRILSTLRAKAVAKYLEGNGIAPDRLFYEGEGSDKPIGDGDTEQGRQMNRRVEFTFIK